MIQAGTNLEKVVQKWSQRGPRGLKNEVPGRYWAPRAIFKREGAPRSHFWFMPKRHFWWFWDTFLGCFFSVFFEGRLKKKKHYFFKFSLFLFRALLAIASPAFVTHPPPCHEKGSPQYTHCPLYTSPSPLAVTLSPMPSSASRKQQPH